METYKASLFLNQLRNEEITHSIYRNEKAELINNKAGPNYLNTQHGDPTGTEMLSI